MKPACCCSKGASAASKPWGISKHVYTSRTCLYWVYGRVALFILLTHILLSHVVAPQVPVSKPHPCSRAQRSHLWVPVTPVGIVDVIIWDGQRLGAKQRTADATEVGKGERLRDENFEFWRRANSYMFSIRGWTADWWVDRTGQMNVCMDEGKESAVLLPGWSL